MAAVYNVPLGGALIAAEIMYGSISLPIVLPALLCSAVATATSWLFLPDAVTYLAIPAYHASASVFVWSVIAAPVIGLVSVGYVRLIGWVSFHRVAGPAGAVAPLVAFSVLGVIGVRYPQLFGNGKDMAHDAFLGNGTVLLFLALFALKPIVTALCLGSGATGGLFTPALSTGAVLGAFLGGLWLHVWPVAHHGAPVGAYAVVGAAAMIAAATQAPLSALVLVLELTRTTDTLMVPMIIAAAIATTLARYLDGYSIYSARLPAASREAVP